MSTPWNRAKEQRYAKQEKRTSKKPGARAQINSGRTWSSLRDVVQDSPFGRMLIDNKTTEARSFTIKDDDWISLKRDANRTPPGCSPAFQIDIRDLRLLVIEDSLWDEIVKYARTLEGKLEELESRDS
jgi:hypothetical protein